MTVVATPFVKKYAPWSVSKADVAKQCPLKFRHSYVHKTEKGRAGEEAQVGITVHRILELCLLGKSVDEAKAIAFDDPKVRLLSVEKEKIEAAMPAVSTFLRRTTSFVDRMGGAEYLIEKKLASSFTGEAVKFFDNSGLLRGVMDVGLLFKNRPHLMVIDHKTGKNRGIEYYSWQFLSYTLLGKVNFPHITHVIPAIHWVQDEYTDVGNPIEVPDINVLLDKVLTHLNTTTVEASQDLNVGNPSKLCGWCDYQPLCPLQNATGGDNGVETETGGGR
jgi:hypothetical protein